MFAKQSELMNREVQALQQKRDENVKTKKTKNKIAKDKEYVRDRAHDRNHELRKKLHKFSKDLALDDDVPQ